MDILAIFFKKNPNISPIWCKPQREINTHLSLPTPLNHSSLNHSLLSTPFFAPVLTHNNPMAISPLILAMILISASRSSLIWTFKLPLTSSCSIPNPSSSSSSLSPFFFLFFFSLPPPSLVCARGPMPLPTSPSPRPPGALPLAVLRTLWNKLDG